MSSTINPYEIGEARPPDGWLVSDWGHFSSIMDWSADNVIKDADGVHLILDEASYTWRQTYHGGEIQSDAVATTGTFTWTAQAPDMVPGAVFGMFTFQEDYRDPRTEFDFEFVGSTTEVQVVVHMAGPDGGPSVGTGRTIDLGFDASEGVHTYQTVVTPYEEAVFLVDGEVIAYFSATDMPGGVWETRPMRSYANLWNTDQSWAGHWTGLPNGEPLEATLLGAEIQPDVYAGIGQVNGTAGADVINGTAEDEIIRGEAGDDLLSGAEGSDFLRAGSGNDLLDGGADDDRMEGGSGDDAFVFDAAGDAAVELAGDGTDEVRSSVDATLGAHLENLVLTGSGDLQGTGNELANRVEGTAGSNLLAGLGGDDALFAGAGNDVLEGGAGHDRLDGGTGQDRLDGGLGDDLLVVDAVGDTVVEGAGGGVDQVSAAVSYALGAEVENLVLTGSGSIHGTGNELANRITGNDGGNGLVGGAGDDTLLGGAGHDTLEGGIGSDRLEGGAGNDAYVLAATGDAVVEAAGGGVDQVDAAFTYALGAEVENLLLTGSAAANGTGNGLGNRITGNGASNGLYGGAGDDSLYGGEGSDTLDGGTGTDRLEGGVGNDTYVLAAAGDAVVELADGGIDQAKSSVSATLAPNVENLVLTGSAAIGGIGNGLANRITGNAGDNSLTAGGNNDKINAGEGSDVLLGGRGADVLTGGAGADDFVFNATKESGLGAKRDVIKDFTKGQDDVVLTSIDANTALDGNQAFTLDAGGSFDAGEVRQTRKGANLLIELNTDGDKAAEASILLNNVTGPLAADDFLL